MDRVMIFCDGSYLFHSLEEYGVRLHYGKLKEELSLGKKTIRALFYGSSPESKRPQQEAFHNALRHLGWDVKVYPLKEVEGKRSKEKQVDIALATDLLLYGHKDLYDIAVLITGDKDYKPAVWAVKEMGKLIKIAGFRKSVAMDLILEVGDENFIPLDDMLDRIKLKVVSKPGSG
ncbi:MAG: hypothetical protein DSO04_07775 [Hadesarchaea archaeon]|nr:MAG: hypothetical protein DSO04_07775 [Hadesarchaea archaeon]